MARALAPGFIFSRMPNMQQTVRLGERLRER
jgi:hypothetical protein